MHTASPDITGSRIDLIQIKKKKINIAVFGHGNVGSQLIQQLLGSRGEIAERRDLDLHIFAVANSKKALLTAHTLGVDWSQEMRQIGKPYTIDIIVEFARKHNLQHLIAVDNTPSADFVSEYPKLISNGFHIIASNKIANTRDFKFYKDLRQLLVKNNREYLYETNVGAGLPLVDTIKLLHLSGENITRIKGVFSGSLSYLFNRFSEGDAPFSKVLRSAIQRGLTEPDPREDLSGRDVGRKLLILARELDLHTEFEDISIQSLIPKQVRHISKSEFLEQLDALDIPFHIKRKNQKKDHVLRYVGDLHGDLSKDDGGIMDVKLVSVPVHSALGQLRGSDSLFEIYTESYGDRPIVIQGAGAGAAVTARGVFGDILRLSEKIN